MPDDIPVGPPGPPPGGNNGGNNNYTPPSNNTGNSGNSGNSGGGGGKKNGGGGGNPYLAAQRKAQRKANQRYLDQAAALDEQIEALKYALGRKGFLKALNQKLTNIRLITGQQDRLLMAGYRARVGELEAAVEDNENAAADQTYANVSNAARERANAVSEAMQQGAGESDVLRSQAMSLRNWDANASEIARSRADTLRSINTNLTDLNVDTRTARANLVIESNSDREQLYTSYYDQRAEALTNIGNIYGQQAELYGYANEQVGSKKTRGKRERAEDLMGVSYDRAARNMGKAWENPGVPGRLMRWDGHSEFEVQNNASRWENRTTNVALDRPEGATLREWTA